MKSVFLGALGACNQAGLVDNWRAYFNSMTQDHGMKPSVYHYTSMIDPLGRAGLLSEAEALIGNIHVEPNSVIWETLLNACRIHGNMETGRKVVERLHKIGKQR